jgi:hypothetical protein
MRLRRVQFTLRQMTAALAVVALVCWAVRLLMLSTMYRERARPYALESLGETNIWMGPKERPRVYLPPSPRARWRREMGEKYMRAAHYPWLAVEPDSAPPD